MIKSPTLYMLELADAGLYTSVSKPKPDRKLTLRMFDMYGNTISREINLTVLSFVDRDTIDQSLNVLLCSMKDEMLEIQAQNDRVITYEHVGEHPSIQVVHEHLEKGIREIADFGYYLAPKKKKKKKRRDK